MEKPFDTRNEDARRLFAQIREEYGLSDIQDSGLPDWTVGYDIAEYIDENGLDYDGIILDEGGDLVNGEPVSRGLSYVIRKSAQIKSADPVSHLQYEYGTLPEGENPVRDDSLPKSITGKDKVSLTARTAKGADGKRHGFKTKPPFATS